MARVGSYEASSSMVLPKSVWPSSTWNVTSARPGAPWRPPGRLPCRPAQRCCMVFKRDGHFSPQDGDLGWVLVLMVGCFFFCGAFLLFWICFGCNIWLVGRRTRFKEMLTVYFSQVGKFNSRKHWKSSPKWIQWMNITMVVKSECPSWNITLLWKKEHCDPFNVFLRGAI